MTSPSYRHLFDATCSENGFVNASHNGRYNRQHARFKRGRGAKLLVSRVVKWFSAAFCGSTAVEMLTGVSLSNSDSVGPLAANQLSDWSGSTWARPVQITSALFNPGTISPLSDPAGSAPRRSSYGLPRL